MSFEVKTIPMRLDRDLFEALANYAIAHNMTRTAVLREALAQFLAVTPTEQLEVSNDGQIESKGSTEGKKPRRK